MITPTDLLRLGRIALVLIGEGVDELLLADASRPTVRLVFRLLPWNWVPRRRAPRGVRLRRSLERLGPIFVKFGQILSTRRDLLPPDIADELAALQDQVPPFPGNIAHHLVETAYEGRFDNWLARFDDDPLASASIAQVHTARLHDGREIVLKVLRPGIERTIRRDLRLLYHLARLLGGLTRDIARLRPREVVAEFEFTLIEELDLVREGANASQLRRNFADSRVLYVPEVYWEFTRPGVLAMERIDGIPVDDIAALQSAGVDLRALAHAGVEIFFTQVFEHNFFHADMHPGNIFVSPQGRYLAVDFGIMGTLDPRDQRYLSQNFVAFFNRDYRAVAEAHVRAGWVPPGTRIDQFESAIRAVCEPIFDKPLSEISFGQVLVRLFAVARRFDMEVQPQLVLLQKTLLNIEGLGRQLYPQLDLWATAKPFLERWVRQRLGWRGALREARQLTPQLAEALPRLPGLVLEQIDQLAEGNLSIAVSVPRIEAELALRRRHRSALMTVLVGCTLLLSGALIYSFTPAGSIAMACAFAGILLCFGGWWRSR